MGHALLGTLQTDDDYWDPSTLAMTIGTRALTFPRIDLVMTTPKQCNISTHTRLL